MEKPVLLARLHWLGHDSFRLDGPPVIYFDPWKLAAGSPQAGIVLVSHGHDDHCSPDDIARISGPDTLVVASPHAAARLKGAKIIRAGEKLVVADPLATQGDQRVTIEAVPAYNTNKKFHPKDAGHVGYVVSVGGERIYFAGDTDHIPEMKAIRCDIALLPVSGVYVMTAAEAVAACRDIRPVVAVPMHYGAGVAGSEADARFFCERVGEGAVMLAQE
ncbi:MAG: MBL fold metallo-hydrolase [Thermoflexales bacterium]|nr:MBL fold metallo-hydrolase [Thermoflexales bacterium]